MLRANIVTDVKPRFDLTEGGMKKREESELLARARPAKTNLTGDIPTVIGPEVSAMHLCCILKFKCPWTHHHRATSSGLFIRPALSKLSKANRY